MSIKRARQNNTTLFYQNQQIFLEQPLYLLSLLVICWYWCEAGLYPISINIHSFIVTASHFSYPLLSSQLVSQNFVSRTNMADPKIEMRDHNENRVLLPILCYPNHFPFLVSTVATIYILITVKYNFSFTLNCQIIFHLHVFFFT